MLWALYIGWRPPVLETVEVLNSSTLLGLARPGFLGLWCLCGEASWWTPVFLIWERSGIAPVEPCQPRFANTGHCVCCTSGGRSLRVFPRL